MICVCRDYWATFFDNCWKIRQRYLNSQSNGHFEQGGGGRCHQIWNNGNNETQHPRSRQSRLEIKTLVSLSHQNLNAAQTQGFLENSKCLACWPPHSWALGPNCPGPKLLITMGLLSSKPLAPLLLTRADGKVFLDNDTNFPQCSLNKSWHARKYRRFKYSRNISFCCCFYWFFVLRRVCQCTFHFHFSQLKPIKLHLKCLVALVFANIHHKNFTS